MRSPVEVAGVAAAGTGKQRLVHDLAEFLRQWEHLLAQHCAPTDPRVFHLEHVSTELRARARTLGLGGISHHLEACSHALRDRNLEGLRESLRVVSEIAYQVRSEIAAEEHGTPAALPPVSPEDQGARPDSGDALRRVGSIVAGRWRLEQLLGVGGMAAVYAARSVEGYEAAIKILHPEALRREDACERFVREGHAVSRLSHPGAVRVLEYGEGGADGREPYLVMELLRGETLQARAQRVGVLPVPEVLDYLDQVLDVLAVAHAQAVIHRDLKPANLFLTNEGRIKVVDFGLARLLDGGPNDFKTRAGLALGTVQYMAPEQAMGRLDEIDAQSDLFALGATAFRLLSGRNIHEARNEAQLLMEMGSTPAPALASVAPTIPDSVCAVVDVAVAFAKEGRYPNARAMQQDVQALRAGRAPPFATNRVAARDLATRRVDRRSAGQAPGPAIPAPSAAPATRTAAPPLGPGQNAAPAPPRMLTIAGRAAPPIPAAPASTADIAPPPPISAPAGPSASPQAAAAPAPPPPIHVPPSPNAVSASPSGGEAVRATDVRGTGPAPAPGPALPPTPPPWASAGQPARSAAAANVAGAAPLAAAPGAAAPAVAANGRALPVAEPVPESRPFQVRTMFGLRAFGGRQRAQPAPAADPKAASAGGHAPLLGLGLRGRSAAGPAAPPPFVSNNPMALPPLAGAQATAAANPAGNTQDVANILKRIGLSRDKRSPLPKKAGGLKRGPRRTPQGSSGALWAAIGAGVVGLGVVAAVLLLVLRSGDAKNTEEASAPSASGSVTTAASVAAAAGADTPAEDVGDVGRLLKMVHNHGGDETPELRALIERHAAIAHKARSEGDCGDATQDPRCAAMVQLRQLLVDKKPLTIKKRPPRDPKQPLSSWLQGLRMPNIPIEDEPRLKRYFEFYTDNPVGRETFEAMLFRCGAYRDVVQAALIRHDLPKDMFALVLWESGCLPLAKSPVGAAGLWQFMPDTARAYRLRVIEGVVDERINPFKATDAGVRFLVDLYRKLRSWDLVLASYNAGPFGIIARVERAGGDVGFWDLVDAKLLPKETADYVPGIQALALIYENLDRLRFASGQKVPPVWTADLEAPPGTRLGMLARAAATSVADLRSLNLDLIGDAIPKVPGGFAIKVRKDVVWQARDTLKDLIAQKDDADMCVSATFDWGRQRFTAEMAKACHHNLQARGSSTEIAKDAVGQSGRRPAAANETDGSAAP